MGVWLPPEVGYGHLELTGPAARLDDALQGIGPVPEPAQLAADWTSSGWPAGFAVPDSRRWLRVGR